MMFRRSKPDLRPTPRADPTRIAVLEHDLLGIPPEPGTLAAAKIAGRPTDAEHCEHPAPVDITTFGDPAPIAYCSGCGSHLAQDDDGNWVRP